MEHKTGRQRGEITRLTDALERNVRQQAESAKKAIRDYKQTLLPGARFDRDCQLRKRQAVEREVSRYMLLQKKLDQIRAQAQIAHAGK
jgi:hypothetical protein